MSSADSNTCGFRFGRPSARYSSSFSTSRILPAHQIKYRGRQFFGQVVDQRRRIVRWQFLDELGDVFGRAPSEELCTRLGGELAEGFHREAAVSFDQNGKRGEAIALLEFTKYLGQVGGMLLLEEIREIGRGAYPKEAFDRILNEIDSLRRHRTLTANS